MKYSCKQDAHGLWVITGTEIQLSFTTKQTAKKVVSALNKAFEKGCLEAPFKQPLLRRQSGLF